MNNRPQLVLSILINLLLVGSILGCVFWPQPLPWHALLNEYSNSLSPERRQIIESAFEKIHADSQGMYQQICAARDESDQLLRANPYNKANYLVAIEHLRKLRDDLGIKINMEIIDLADQLTPPEREVLANVTHNMSIKDYVGNKNANCGVKPRALK